MILNPVDKECMNCKKIMIAVRSDRKYCCYKCSKKQKGYKSSKLCLNCQNLLKNIHGHQKFCDQICYVDFKRKEKLQRRQIDQEYRQKVNLWSRENTAKIKLFLRDYKLEKGCLDCGYKAHHAALQFDHVKGEKVKNVCHTKSIESAKIEIEKCEVVCANCHHIRTFNRLENKGKIQ